MNGVGGGPSITFKKKKKKKKMYDFKNNLIILSILQPIRIIY